MKKRTRRYLSMFLALLLTFGSVAWDTNLVVHAAEDSVIIDTAEAEYKEDIGGQTENLEVGAPDASDAQDGNTMPSGPSDADPDPTGDQTVVSEIEGGIALLINEEAAPILRGKAISQEDYEAWKTGARPSWELLDEEASDGTDLKALLEELAGQENTSGYYVIATDNGGYDSEGMEKIPDTIGETKIKGVILVASNGWDNQTGWFSHSFRTAGIETDTELLLSGEFGREGEEFVLTGSGSVAFYQNDNHHTKVWGTLKGQEGSETRVSFCHSMALGGLDAADWAETRFCEINHGGPQLTIGAGGIRLGKVYLETDATITMMQENILPEFTGGGQATFETVAEGEWLATGEGDNREWYPRYVVREEHDGWTEDKEEYVLKDGKYYPVTWDDQGCKISGEGSEEKPQGAVVREHQANIRLEFITDAENYIGKKFNAGEKAVDFANVEVGYRWYKNIYIGVPGIGIDYNVNLKGCIYSDPTLRGTVITEEEYRSLKDGANVWDMLNDGRETVDESDLSLLLELLARGKENCGGHFVITSQPCEYRNESGEKTGELHYRNTDIAEIPAAVGGIDVKGLLLLANNWTDEEGKFQSNYVELGGISVPENTEVILYGDFRGENEASDFVVKGGGNVLIGCQLTECTALPFVKGTGDGTKVSFIDHTQLYGLDATGWAETRFCERYHNGPGIEIGAGGIRLGKVYLEAGATITMMQENILPEFTGGQATFKTVENGEWLATGEGDNWEWYPRYVVRKVQEDGSTDETNYVLKDGKYYPVTWDDQGCKISGEGSDSMPQGAEADMRETGLRVMILVNENPWDLEQVFADGAPIVKFKDAADGYQWYGHICCTASFRSEQGDFNRDFDGQIDINGKAVNWDACLQLQRYEGETPKDNFDRTFYGEYGDVNGEYLFYDIETLLAYIEQDIQQSGSGGYYSIAVRKDSEKMLGSLDMAGVDGLKGIAFTVWYDDNAERSHQFGGLTSVSLGEGQILKFSDIYEAGLVRSDEPLVISGKGTVLFNNVKIYRPVVCRDGVVRLNSNTTLRSLEAKTLELDEGTACIGKELKADKLQLVRRADRIDYSDEEFKYAIDHELVLYAGAKAEIGDIDPRYNANAPQGEGNSDRLLICLENDGTSAMPGLTLKGTLAEGSCKYVWESDNLVSPGLEIRILSTQKLGIAADTDRYEEHFRLFDNTGSYDSLSSIEDVPPVELLNVIDESIVGQLSVLVNRDTTEEGTATDSIIFTTEDEAYYEQIGQRKKCYGFIPDEDGNRKLSQYLYVTGVEKEISVLEISPVAAQVYTGSPLEPAVTVRDGDKVLVKDTDYTVSYSSNTNAGTGKIVVKMILGSGYLGETELSFKISEKSLSELTVEDIPAGTYTGSAITPAVTVKDGTKTLVSGTDYTVSYSSNTNAGTANVTVTGKGNYTGSVKKSFVINPKNVSGLTVTGLSDATYTGSAIKPAVTVKDGTKTLVSGTDYTVSYSANTNAGTANVTVTGKGNYTGSVKKSFKIKPMNVSGLTVASIPASTYTGSAIKPAVTVKNGTKTLVSGTDYTVSYSGNTNAGTAYVTVTGKGNYTGSVKKSFQIKPINVSGLTVTASSEEFYTGKALKPAVTVKNGKKKLVKDTDYTLAYKNNTKVGTATITVTCKGNYTGSKTLKFKILGTVTKVTAASAGYESVELSWNQASGASGYKIYRATNKSGTYKLVKTVKGEKVLSYKDTKLTAGTTYYYKVAPYGTSKTGPESKIVSAKPVPADVAISSVKNSAAGTATVTWKKVSGASGYEVYRATGKNGKYTMVASTKSVSFKNTKLTKNKTYYYKVRAYRVVNGKKVYGNYSPVKSVTIKK